ncbi:hypothetical protein GIB67_015557 [Kingdonia uniflora]|uniref:Uncharacterized protein n=1 Tax=Kingdonia uniflora TaxID=39325 RepID=A0A7J7LU49_9MAGN|nr:hypothetical protein GIB67_015557 [Kingdonia uniflora]
MSETIGELSDVSNPNLHFSFDPEIEGSSLSLSLPSEPPDIGNWFSSYIYESPLFDSEGNCGGFSIGERWGRKRGICLEGEESLGEVSNAGERDGSVVGKRRFCDDDALDKNEEKYDLKRNLSEISGEKNCLQDKLKENHGVLPCQDDLTSCLDNKGTIQNWEGRSASQEDSGQGDNRSATDNEDPIRTTRTSPRRGGQEEEANNSEINGFISTKKKRNTSDNTGSLSKRSSKENEVKNSTDANEEPMILPRMPLSERTNYHHEAMAPEITGKWRCPQSSKPDLGPPLKQLRLERWVRRS